MGLLNDLGYQRVRDYPGGLAEWTDRGGELANASGRHAEDVAAPTGAGGPPAASGAAAGAPARRRDRMGLLEAIDLLSVQGWIASWAGMVVGCGLLYWLAGATGGGLEAEGEPVPSSFGGLVTALYFSVVTATTLGFGDVVPVGPVRLLAIAEAAAGMVLFGIVVAKVVSRRQDELVREIHAVTLEERLGRVLSNLHLTTSELSTLARLCSEGGATAEAICGRFESVPAAPDLRAPDGVPPPVPSRRPGRGGDARGDPRDAGQRAARAGRARLVRAGRRGARRSLERIATLAERICGECVPIDHSTHLTAWMDDVRERARALTLGRG